MWGVVIVGPKKHSNSIVAPVGEDLTEIAPAESGIAG
jgi:hypothetical protein